MYPFFRGYALFLLALSPNWAVAQTGDVVGIHDPCVIKVGKAYYLFSTGGRIQARKSDDLRSWKSLGDTLPELPEWTERFVPDAEDRWAPDISYFNGKFHLYYSVSTFGSNRSCIGLATNITLDPASSKYKWEDQGMVVASRPETDKFNAIDPNIVIDERNQPWLSFGSFWNGIMLVRLDSKTGKPTDRLLHIAGRHGGAIEAPFIIRHGKWYFLFVSFDSCCKGVESTYKVMVGRSNKVDGPYLDLAGKQMSEGAGTLVLSGNRNIRGPGHNSVLTVGGVDYIFHHYYDSDNSGRPTLQIRPLVWSTDGWPMAGEPGVLSENRPDSTVTMTGKWLHSVEFGKENAITLLQNGKINREDAKATWMLKGSTLQLRWPRADAPKGTWIDECIVNPNGEWYVGRNQQGLLIRGRRER